MPYVGRTDRYAAQPAPGRSHRYTSSRQKDSFRDPAERLWACVLEQLENSKFPHAQFMLKNMLPNVVGYMD